LLAQYRFGVGRSMDPVKRPIAYHALETSDAGLERFKFSG
jgi:hypothetical protein